MELHLENLPLQKETASNFNKSTATKNQWSSEGLFTQSTHTKAEFEKKGEAIKKMFKKNIKLPSLPVNDQQGENCTDMRGIMRLMSLQPVITATPYNTTSPTTVTTIITQNATSPTNVTTTTP